MMHCARMLFPLLACFLPACLAAPGFASYAALSGRPYKVGYDERALTINGERTLFLSGSLHYPRGTPDDWDGWLDEAASSGLNMVEIYVFWNLHMPSEDGEGVWSGNANFTDFIGRCASRGLFVYLRIGPYVCAEWTYGGVPLWLAQKEGIRFRETNPLWQDAMQAFFDAVVTRTAAAHQFAPQGGPVMLVQVENELQPTDRPYVDWCGKMAAESLRKVGASSVPLTMCNGETAANAINTCNGEDCAPFAQAHGQNGRVLVDQPALWTENEGGFALWGGSAAGEPSYFWARSSAELAYNSVRWFGSGGSLLNYYMFAGGSTRGLWAGAALTTAYATDVPVCHDGLRHGAKFHFLQLMHAALTQVAQQLVASAVPPSPARLDRLTGEEAGGDGGSVEGAEAGQQLGWRYGSAAIVESNGTRPVTVSLAGLGCAGSRLSLGARSAQIVLLHGGGQQPSASAACSVRVLFRSDGLLPGAPLPPVHRSLSRLPTPALRWEAWQEPLANPQAHGSPADGLPSASGPDAPSVAPAAAAAWPALRQGSSGARLDIGSHGPSVHAKQPVEQGLVTHDRTAFASYTRYATPFVNGCAAPRGGEGSGKARSGRCVLAVEVGCATALLVLVDGQLVGEAHDRNHEPCNVTINVSLDVSNVRAGEHSLCLVSEHLGYANYGFRAPLSKGLVGTVVLHDGVSAVDITHGAWTIRSGLDGERLRLMTAQGQAAVRWVRPQPQQQPAPRSLTWYRAQFDTPPELLARKGGAQLHVNMSGFGRGHGWLNGHSIGRFWLLARTTGPEAGARPTQALYHLPSEWLSRSGAPNVLTVLEGLGGDDSTRTSLYVARLAAGPGPAFDLATWATEMADCEM